jgi:hypothetical protein
MIGKKIPRPFSSGGQDLRLPEKVSVLLSLNPTVDPGYDGFPVCKM